MTATTSTAWVNTAWINTVSRDHVQQAVAGGFTQANHGKPHALRRMRRDDWLVFYSPRTAYPDGDPLQAFTAIGRIADDETYQADDAGDWRPWRRRVAYLPALEAPVRPLLPELHATREAGSHWGYVFRRGVIEIDAHDLAVLRRAMAVSDA